MAMPSSLSRRGAVYHWRRRLPAQIAEQTDSTYLKISLQVREYPAARFLAALLTAYAEELFLNLSPLISAEQLKHLFAAKLSEQRDKLRVARFSAERSPGFAASHSAREDLAFGQAFRMIAQRGPDVSLMPHDRERLTGEGLDSAQIDDITMALHEIKRDGFNKPSVTKIEGLLKQVGAEVSLQNIRFAEPVYFHALAAANLQNGKQTAFDPDAVLAKPQELASASDRNLAAPVPVHASSRQRRSRKTRTNPNRHSQSSQLAL